MIGWDHGGAPDRRRESLLMRWLLLVLAVVALLGWLLPPWGGLA